jgi:CcmD family protein
MAGLKACTTSGARRPLARTSGFLLAVLLVTAAVPLALQPPPPQDAKQEYVPVDPTQEQEQLPAAPLVMGAYAVVWVAVVLYLWSLWRRLSRVERELAQVSRRIEAGGKR